MMEQVNSRCLPAWKLLSLLGIGFSILAIALVIVTAQEVPSITKQDSVSQLKGERDKERENEVAQLFESIRAGSKLPHLKRIEHRDSLEQEVCTIVLTGKPPKHSSTNTFGFYTTGNPNSASPELSKVALFNNLHPKGNPSLARYSVAVWSVKDSQTGKPTYSVGVELFWSAAMEFFDYYFTDDIYYHNDWKKLIVPQCRGR
jgi:hypothetical protein